MFCFWALSINPILSIKLFAVVRNVLKWAVKKGSLDHDTSRLERDSILLIVRLIEESNNI